MAGSRRCQARPGGRRWRAQEREHRRLSYSAPLARILYMACALQKLSPLFSLSWDTGGRQPLGRAGACGRSQQCRGDADAPHSPPHLFI